MSQMSNRQWNVKEGIFLLFVLFLGFYIAVNFLSPPLAVKTFGFHFSVVKSDSMAPALNRGDLVFICSVDPYSIEEEDIISFEPVDQFYVVHAVADIDEDDQGQRIFKTKPYLAEDRNDWDYWGLKPEQIIGHVSFSIPMIGHVFLFLRSGIGLLTIALIGLVWIGYDYIK